MRTPHAAKQLTKQVREALGRIPDSKAGLGTSKPVGDGDGLGVQRSVEFDKVASKFLLDRYDALLSDRRVEGIDQSGKGIVTVTFTHLPLADQRDPFDLTAPRAVEEEPPAG